MSKQNEKPTIVIRKEEVVEGGHHGGAWKVAYADFVTAMMAFFLLMWLLNATTQEQKRGLADYFSPNSLTSRTNSGFGKPFGGSTPNIDGSLASDRGTVQVVMGPQHPQIDLDEEDADTPAQSDQPRPAAPSPVSTGREGAGVPAALPPIAAPAAALPAAPPAESAAEQAQAAEAARQKAEQAKQAKQERRNFERAAEQIREAIRNDPALAGLNKQLAIDITPEGLRIQLLDEDKQPMFATGAATMNDRARAVLTKVAAVLLRLSEPIAIAGHTDGAPYRGNDRTNWDLSADRANATRRLLIEAGVPEARIRSVTGNADRDPLLPNDPMAAANRRIAIMVLRQAGGS